jgi:WD40 repeat protein
MGTSRHARNYARWWDIKRKSLLYRGTSVSLAQPAEKGASVWVLGHAGEVCGLKWREDGELLASGGNDNVVHV